MEAWSNGRGRLHDGGYSLREWRDYHGGMATSIDQRNFVKTALRLPPEVHAAIHESAQQAGRSYNAELVERIQQSLRSDADARRGQLVENALMALQALLALHVQRFFDYLPEAQKKDPANVAVREMAAAIEFGSLEQITDAIQEVFFPGSEERPTALAREMLNRRRNLGRYMGQLPAEPTVAAENAFAKDRGHPAGSGPAKE